MPEPWLSHTEIWLLGLFLVTFLGNGIFPAPVTLYVLWMGQFHMPIPVIIIGTMGTILGWVFFGGKLSRMLPPKATEKLNRHTPALYKKLFLKRPGLFVFLFNSLPFPFDAMRLLAVANGVRPNSLVVPLALGRIIRYTFLVYVGSVLSQYNWFFWALIAIVLLPVILKLLFWRETPLAQEALVMEPIDAGESAIRP